MGISRLFFSSVYFNHLPSPACDIVGILTKKTIEIQMFRLLMKETVYCLLHIQDEKHVKFAAESS